MPSPALCTNFEIPSSKTPAFPPHPVLPTIKYKKTPQEGLRGKRAKAARKFVTLITGEITWSCRKWIGNFWGLRTFAFAKIKFTKLRLFLSSFLQPFKVFFWPVLFPTYLFLSEENHCWFPFFCLPNTSFKRAINVAFLLRNITH